jgi:WS/DGAT/MGAT family acyltransferase
VGGLGRLGWSLGRVPGLVRRTRRAGAAAAALAAQSGIAVPREGMDAPACSINKGFTAQRRFARVTVDLADVGIVKEAAEGTVNDVVLAMVAGSLRRYLLARDDLPGQPLVATVPVSIDRRASADFEPGNRLSHLVTSLATDIADPWERLGRIREITRESKARLPLSGPELLNDWLEVFPPFIVRSATRHRQRQRQTGGLGLVANVLVSNLRGPPQPWMFGSAVVEEAYMTGSPNGGLGVTIVLWDYAGKLRFGILTTADSVDDASELVEGLRASLRELVAIAQRLLQERSPTR